MPLLNLTRPAYEPLGGKGKLPLLDLGSDTERETELRKHFGIEGAAASIYMKKDQRVERKMVLLYPGDARLLPAARLDPSRAVALAFGTVRTERAGRVLTIHKMARLDLVSACM